MTRKQFELTQEEFDVLVDAGKPVPYMVFGGREPSSPQDNANEAWHQLGNKRGFDHMTVEPICARCSGNSDKKDDRFFTAELKEANHDTA